MKTQLQKRLVQFSAQIVSIDQVFRPVFASRHLYMQMVRSSTSAALNYGEAQMAETRKDFIHKIGLVVKELKETEVNLEVVEEVKLCKDPVLLQNLLMECKELIAIFMATRNTARRNSDAA